MGDGRGRGIGALGLIVLHGQGDKEGGLGGAFYTRGDQTSRVPGSTQLESSSKPISPECVDDSLAITADKLFHCTFRSSMPSSPAVLTSPHHARAAKGHAKRRQLAEVVFDDEARRSVSLLSHSRVLPSYQVQGVPYRFS